MASTKKRILIDCDAGTDDALAIMMALGQPSVELVAITAVFGNAPLENTCMNVLRVLKVCNRTDIPVYKGCGVSLTGKDPVGDGFHGDDGLGDVVLDGVDPVDSGAFQKEHAALALVRLAAENRGEYTLVAVGPLTNIALALHLDPTFGENLKECYIMGGNTDGKGNITPTAEFNTFSDPEAAHFVFTHFRRKIYLAPLTVCRKYSWTWEEYDAFLASSSTDKAKFVKLIETKMNVRQKVKGSSLYCIWDQVVIATAMDPTIMTEVKEVHAAIELSGQLTRGQMVVDWNKHLKKEENIFLIKELDKAKFDDLIYAAIVD